MAAGQGFKTFTVGEVLTAADVNGYLMQGVLVFATTAARDSAITSPQEGQFAFTKDTNSLWYYDGAAWVASGATGDIEGVTAGVGISGGGTSGTVTVTNSMATAITTNGDTLFGTGSGTFSRLGIGSTGNVLTVASGIPSWSAPAGTAQNFSLLNSGGTALTGSATVTVSGISGMNQLLIILDLASADGATGPGFGFRFNTDTGSNYSRLGGYVLAGGTVGAVTTASGTWAGGSDFSSNANSAAWGGLMLYGCNSAGIKTYSSMFTTDAAGGANNATKMISGIYSGSSTISSVSAFVSAGSWDAGRIYIYGSA